MVYRHHQRYLIDFSFSFALASQGFNGDAKFSSLYTFGISVHHIRFKIYTIVYNKHVSTTDYHVPYTQVILLSLAELFRIKHVSISTHVVMIFYTYCLSLTSGRTRAFFCNCLSFSSYASARTSMGMSIHANSPMLSA